MTPARGTPPPLGPVEGGAPARTGAPRTLAAELRWVWSTWYGQLAILTAVTGLLWLTGRRELAPAPMLLALTRGRLLAEDFPTVPALHPAGPRGVELAGTAVPPRGNLGPGRDRTLRLPGWTPPGRWGAATRRSLSRPMASQAAGPVHDPGPAVKPQAPGSVVSSPPQRSATDPGLNFS